MIVDPLHQSLEMVSFIFKSLDSLFAVVDDPIGYF